MNAPATAPATVRPPADGLTQPRLKQVPCIDAHGLHRMAYWEWGDPSAQHVVVCVHGLTRQGRDFDTLARDLAPHCRVICPDVVGRGQSSWLPEPSGYGIPHYVADMVPLLARLDVDQVDWVGTSMGGLIGMGLAALPGNPIRRLVLNDVGPTIEYSAIQRIGRYVGQLVHWKTEEEAAAALAAIATGFGPHTPEQWLELSRPQLKREGDGYTVHYDPAIGVPFRAITPELAQAAEAATWAMWQRIQCPTLLIRGAESDLLSAATAQKMTETGPKARLHTVPGVGHAPTLVQEDQRAVVRAFLLGP